MEELEIIVDENNYEIGIRNILKKIREHWNSDGIKFKSFTDGITNKLIGCFYTDPQTSRDEVLLVRIYGNNTELLIDRIAEKKNISYLHEHDLAPELYGTFKNGLIYEFIPGSTLTTTSVYEPSLWHLVATNLARMHKLPLSSEESAKVPMLKSKSLKFLNLIPNSLSDPVKNARNKVTFIDYEYAELNFQAFDIGNHFAEFPGIDSSNGIDYTKYPSRDFQFNWIRAYLEEFKESNVTDDDVVTLYKQVNKFALASHFLWTLWSLIQAEHSTIDYDFIAFGSLRYNEYLAKKDEFLNL
ncbi:CLUMA_CG004939, isoform A [Clunio marinus]|uniref:ethanolamine kinase n=1 Tax=Clunio marinus TaxID=568069 RepID=A0A1J1HTE0_9DIPT|nr:CLUMA_CG004939, isoform A [Clunio marinus]